MVMKKAAPAANPEDYVASLDGWRLGLVTTLRRAVLAAAPFEEAIKWGHLVYFNTGPVLLIRAEEKRVLFGLWRGQRLREIAPRLKPGGKYEMATWELREGDAVDAGIAKRLARAAAELNRRFGDPTVIPAATTRKAAAGQPTLSPSGSARKTPR